MFEHIELAPPDPILGLTEAFNKDTRTAKINLGVGVYKEENNTTPVFKSVKLAEERILASEKTKTYVSPLSGTREYTAAVQQLLFGAGHEIVTAKRAVSAHTPGGTGALRVAGDFIKKMLPNARIWLSNPTWENHNGVFTSAGLEVMRYPYYDQDGKALAFNDMLAALEQAAPTDVVLFHACCHNPTGMDPDAAQWRQLAELAQRKGFLPFFDFAYQGLGDGLAEDAAGMLEFCGPGRELLISSSFSKNFGLYNERVGALTVVTQNEEAAKRVLSQVQLTIRTNYSNPPAHGALIVTTILNDPELRALWESEVHTMCDRINGMRRMFVDTLAAKGVQRDFSFITRQKGMFSFSGLTRDQVDRLRDEFAIYIVGSGRINVAAMTPANMDPLCTAIATVL